MNTRKKPEPRKVSLDNRSPIDMLFERLDYFLSILDDFAEAFLRYVDTQKEDLELSTRRHHANVIANGEIRDIFRKALLYLTEMKSVSEREMEDLMKNFLREKGGDFIEISTKKDKGKIHRGRRTSAA